MALLACLAMLAFRKTRRMVPGVPTGSIGMPGTPGELPLPVVQVTPVMMPMAGCDAMMVDAYRARNIHQAGQLSACG